MVMAQRGVGMNGLKAASPHVTVWPIQASSGYSRSEEHTSELQSLRHVVCRLQLEKKRKQQPLIGGWRCKERWHETSTPAAAPNTIVRPHNNACSCSQDRRTASYQHGSMLCQVKDA